MIFEITVESGIKDLNGGYTFETKNFNLKASFLEKTPAGSNNRWYYLAIIKECDMPNEFIKLIEDNRASWLLRSNDIFGNFYRANIIRKRNKKFKPPKNGWNNNIYFIDNVKEIKS